MKFEKYVGQKYEVPMHKTINKKLKTDIPPEKRSFKNLPKYADGKNKVRFQDWLEIKGEGKGSYGKSANGKWYGYSHRAVYGFKSGDKVEGDSLGKARTSDPDFTIKDDDHAKQVAIQFSKNVS